MDLCVCVHIHTYIHTDEESRKEEMAVSFVLPHRFAFLWSGREYHLEEPPLTVQSFPVPTAYTERWEGPGGAQPNMQCWLLLRAALFISWFINVRKHPLKVPGNTCREHTPALWSVNRLLWAWEEEAVKEWRKEMTRMGARAGQRKAQWTEGMSPARHQGFLLNFVENKIQPQKTVKRKINSFDPEWANSS